MVQIKLSKYGWANLGLSIGQFCAIVALQAVVASIFIGAIDVGSNDRKSGSGKSIIVYLFIFCFSQLFQLLLAVNALVDQNTIQVFGHLAFCGALLAFSAFEYVQIKDAVRSATENNLLHSTNEDPFPVMQPYLVTCIVLHAVIFLAYCWIAYKLYLEFGWKIFKKIGADPKTLAMYQAYLIFVMLLKFDFFFFVAFCVQFIVLVIRDLGDPEFALTIVALPAAFIVLLLAIYGVRNENRYIVALWFAGLAAAFAYFLFKIIRIYDATQTWKYEGSGKFLTLFAVLGLVMIVGTTAVTIRVTLNFGRGLKEHLGKPNRPASTEMTNPNRQLRLID